MFTIKKATTNDIQLIKRDGSDRVSGYLPGNSFKRTMDYMMDWMYSPKKPA